MARSILRQAAHRGLWIVDRLRLRGVLLRAFRHLPPSLRVRLGLLQVRLGLMDGLIMVPEHDLENSMEAAIRTFGPDQLGPGDAYLEFGVYVGTSMACMYRAARRAGASNLRLVGFDSFQGMPPDDGLAIPTWQPSQLYADIRLTRANLKRQGVPASRVQLVPGWFEDSLTAETREQLGIDRAAIIMMDCVLESSTRKALEFCAPLIRDRAVIFFDDWSADGLAERGMGESRAFSDWLAAHPEMIAEDAPNLGYESDARPFVVSRRVAEEPQSGKLAQPTGSAAGRS